MASRFNDHFVNGGWRRARAAEAPGIRAAVEQEYAARLQEADKSERKAIEAEVEQEIKKRLDRVAPRWGLYFSPGGKSG